METYLSYRLTDTVGSSRKAAPGDIADGINPATGDDVIVDGNIITEGPTRGASPPPPSAWEDAGGAPLPDYDDDGDLDLYVINSPGGDNALSGDETPGDLASVDAPPSGLLLPALQTQHNPTPPPPVPFALETVDGDPASADAFLFQQSSEGTDRTWDETLLLMEIEGIATTGRDYGAGPAEDVVQADWPEPEADAIPVGDGCVKLDSGAIVCLL